MHSSRRSTSSRRRPRPHDGRGRPRRLHGDDGQAGLLVGLIVLALAAVAAALVGHLGAAVAERTRARTAADAAALAGVTGGRRAADQVATANDGSIESYRLDGEVVEVTVVVGSTRATSRAAPAPDQRLVLLPGGVDDGGGWRQPRDLPAGCGRARPLWRPGIPIDSVRCPQPIRPRPRPPTVPPTCR